MNELESRRRDWTEKCWCYDSSLLVNSLLWANSIL